jgi:hypothetical protein
MNQGAVFGFLVGLVFVQLFCILNLVNDMRKTSLQVVEMLQVNHKTSNVETQTKEVK